MPCLPIANKVSSIIGYKEPENNKNNKIKSFDDENGNNKVFSWTRHSDEALLDAETKLLSNCSTPYKRFYVDIGSVVGQNDRIWTITMNEGLPKTPLVMLHGMGAGAGLWCPNLDDFAATRPVYAIDLLGFGRSSRPKFDTANPLRVEEQWVESIEAWRRKMNLSHFILLGHSLGAYLSTAYSIKYRDRVRHLILADPWGMLELPSKEAEREIFHPLMRVYLTAVEPFNPLWPVRVAGPAGKWVVTKARATLVKKYSKYVRDSESVIPEYIYHCNSQPPRGESAFHSLMTRFWAKNPMIKRIYKLDQSLPITVLNGSESVIDPTSGEELIKERNTNNIYAKVIEGASHHIYLDIPDIFNKYVLEACDMCDAAELANSGSNLTNNGQLTNSNGHVRNSNGQLSNCKGLLAKCNGHVTNGNGHVINAIVHATNEKRQLTNSNGPSTKCNGHVTNDNRHVINAIVHVTNENRQLTNGKGQLANGSAERHRTNQSEIVVYRL